MATCEYRYVLSLFRSGGEALGRFAITPDFVPAEEHTKFRGLRCGDLPPALPVSADTRIDPIWHATAGEPYAAGFRVRVQTAGHQATDDFPLDYFADLAHAASTTYVERGQLKQGETFSYLISAYPAAQDRHAPVPGRIAIRSSVPPLTVLPDAAEQTFLHNSVPTGPTGAADEADARVYVPRHVLDETAEQTRSAGSKETGGILIGHIHRSMDSGDLFLEVTAAMPARHAASELTRLTFTSATWSAVQAAIGLRHQQETMLGWWHSHSYLKDTCATCAKKHACKRDAAFLSAEDRALHRTVFPRAFSLALVLSDAPCSGLTWKLFGWRQGKLVERAFHILGGRVGTDAVAECHNANVETEEVPNG